jgi:hypothetical protein
VKISSVMTNWWDGTALAVQMMLRIKFDTAAGPVHHSHTTARVMLKNQTLFYSWVWFNSKHNSYATQTFFFLNASDFLRSHTSYLAYKHHSAQLVMSVWRMG